MLTWEDECGVSTGDPLSFYQIIRRNGTFVLTPFGPSEIALMRKWLFSVMRDTLAVWIKPRLLLVSKLNDRAVSVRTTKLHGFFSANKANLRNAP
jgi:hypothetical protein